MRYSIDGRQESSGGSSGEGNVLNGMEDEVVGWRDREERGRSERKGIGGRWTRNGASSDAPKRWFVGNLIATGKLVWRATNEAEAQHDMIQRRQGMTHSQGEP